MSSSDIQALFSNLRPRSREPSSNSSAPTNYAQPRAVSSSFLPNSNVPSTPPPPFSATAEETVSHTSNRGGNQEYRASNGTTAQNLLNLLNHGGASGLSAGAREQSPAAHHITNPSISASDLVARFMSPTGSTRSDIRFESAIQSTTGIGLNEGQTSKNPLLELLNRQSAASASSRLSSQNVQPQDHEESTPAVDTIVESIEQPAVPTKQSDPQSEREITPFETPAPAASIPPANKPIFTYQNPFEALQASRGQTPKASNPVPLQPTTPSFNFAASQSSSPAAISARKKLTPKLRSTPSGSVPQNEFESQSTDAAPAQLTKNAATKEELPIREKQPAVEDQTVAQSIEMTEDAQADIHDATETSKMDVVKESQDNSGEWEDIPDKTMSDDSATRVVPVYNFPIKAFVSITLNLTSVRGVGIRDDGVMEISRMKKDFDQLDRSLAAATSRYITYAFTKHGGVRIIRQDDGSDRHVFKSTQDRIFNVSFCTAASSAPPTDNQAVLGTGISGSVYYATVSKAGNDLFEKNQLESESLIFPPWPQGDENTAGGVLKTRAKKSSRHPEFFAIGRGKSIHLIWPATAMSPRYGISETSRAVDVEKLYEDRPLQISTGKAGKDFTFSEDDTMIVSLDKTGRLRFWDIRTLIDEANATAPRVKGVNIDTPVLSLSTASPAEKSWPTSVLFVDKARPYSKGGAQRYVLVGLRQNHTLQLWDIALGKAVQEINFPHENETDGICSVNYHPSSGILVVGHPTRNSVFFIHLSAPRYTLGSTISQAEYVTRSAGKDPSLPKPESTACMSGIREISFASKGELRSIELLPVQKDAAKTPDESTSVFELYIVHSRGVTCLGINKEDLGWNADSKVVQSVDALKEGIVTVKDLKLGSVIEEPARSKSPVKEIQQPAKIAKKKAKKSGQQAEEVNGVEEVITQQQPAESAVFTNGIPDGQSDVVIPDVPVPEQETPMPKESKKAKKKAAQAAQAAEVAKSEVRTSSPTKSAPVQSNGNIPNNLNTLENMIDSTAPKIGQPEPMVPGVSSEQLDKELSRVEQAISGKFKAEFDTLYQSISADRSAMDQVSNSRQETILRLVSESLNNNVEKGLTRIVSQQIQQNVIPLVTQSVAAEVGSTLAKSLNDLLPQEIEKHLPNALNTALQSSYMTRVISDSVSQKLGKHLEIQMKELISTTVTPVFKNIATAAANKVTAETEDRLTSRINQLELQRAADNDKIDNLSSVLQGMAATLQAISSSQVAFQEQILKDRRDPSASESGTTSSSRQVAKIAPSSAAVARPVKTKSKEELELEEITRLMAEEKFEAATIKWLQSPQSPALFDEVFIRFTPDYLASDVSALVAFSVAVTVANALHTNLERRMEWISAALDAMDPSDPELIEVASSPALSNILIGKLEGLYMQLAEHDPNNNVLRMIPGLVKKACDMKAYLAMRASGGSVATHT